MKLMETNNLFLACDRAGNPSAWLNYEMAVHLIATNRVLAPLGQHSRVVYGGTNAVSGLRAGLRGAIDQSCAVCTRRLPVPVLR
jgi:hypothetical protein